MRPPKPPKAPPGRTIISQKMKRTKFCRLENPKCIFFSDEKTCLYNKYCYMQMNGKKPSLRFYVVAGIVIFIFAVIAWHGFDIKIGEVFKFYIRPLKRFF